MFMTLAIGDLDGMSEPVKKGKPRDEYCPFLQRASVRHRTKAASSGFRAAAMLNSAFQSRAARRRDEALGRDSDLLDNPRFTDRIRESR